MTLKVATIGSAGLGVSDLQELGLRTAFSSRTFRQRVPLTRGRKQGQVPMEVKGAPAPPPPPEVTEDAAETPWDFLTAMTWSGAGRGLGLSDSTDRRPRGSPPRPPPVRPPARRLGAGQRLGKEALRPEWARTPTDPASNTAALHSRTFFSRHRGAHKSRPACRQPGAARDTARGDPLARAEPAPAGAMPTADAGDPVSNRGLPRCPALCPGHKAAGDGDRVPPALTSSCPASRPPVPPPSLEQAAAPAGRVHGHARIPAPGAHGRVHAAPRGRRRETGPPRDRRRETGPPPGVGGGERPPQPPRAVHSRVSAPSGAPATGGQEAPEGPGLHLAETLETAEPQPPEPPHTGPPFHHQKEPDPTNPPFLR